MSRSRRNFSAEFKTNLVLQLLKGEKELNVLAVENDIQPNLLRNWKKEFLTNASLAFDNKREDNLREKLAEERKEKAEYAKKVGQLTMQVDWLKKNLKKLSDLTTRVNLVRNLSTTKELPVSTGAKLLGINRTSIYYGGIPVSEEELECKAIIDHLHTDNPTWGARQMSAQLKLRGYQVGRRKAGRYMREMDITPIYPKMNLSKRMKQAKVCPYLLRNAVIDRSNQAWSIDITYIPMKHGFLYLTAIIDWYSRCIVGWDVDDTLDTTMVINACKKAFKVAKPLIINSDQGSQFTSDKYIEFIRNNGIRQSMDGKSRWADNIMIERWFRSFKYEEAYLTEYANLKEAREAIGRYIYTYNFERCHQSIGNKRPAEVYYPVMLLDAARAAA
ncbi:MAG: IS3 family transposase [Clostridium sp.]